MNMQNYKRKIDNLQNVLLEISPMLLKVSQSEANQITLLMSKLKLETIWTMKTSSWKIKKKIG